MLFEHQFHRGLDIFSVLVLVRKGNELRLQFGKLLLAFNYFELYSPQLIQKCISFHYATAAILTALTSKRRMKRRSLLQADLQRFSERPIEFLRIFLH